MDVILILVAVVLIIVLILKVAGLQKQLSEYQNVDNSDALGKKIDDEFKSLKADILNSESALRREVNESVHDSVSKMGQMISKNQQDALNLQSSTIRDNGDNMLKQLNNMNNSINTQLGRMSENIENRLKTSSSETQKNLSEIRVNVENKLTELQNTNRSELDKMRGIVDEKLQKTLEERISKSFEFVSVQLENVYKGLGEMQNLATGVGDLKKVLTNVKTRGILGEVQLGAILSEILAPEQYKTNFITKKGSRDPVEYAIKLPTDDGTGIYLPIDSKFPGDTYKNLLTAYDTGDKKLIDEAAKILVSTIKSEAKDISTKYLDPPNTTDFAIMFLPFEGLYAEVVNRGMVEELQSTYRVNIAGPSTMAALLNSLQMGFRTFAIQKRSGEVWQVLGAVKTEFNKFSAILEKTQKKLEEANKELDDLVGVRTRQMKRKLSKVEMLDENTADNILLEDNDEY